MQTDGRIAVVVITGVVVLAVGGVLYVLMSPPAAPVTAPASAPWPAQTTGTLRIVADVTPGSREGAIGFKDVRLSASVQVIHKRAMGSCARTLRASPQGVTYDTANNGDAFSVAPTDIETFEVDYLARNLKHKIKKGKTFNFTNPDGNADRFFVFHRDVEKVRQRLLIGVRL